MQFQGVNGQSFSKEGVKNISSMFKLSGSQSVTLKQKQSQGKREKSKLHFKSSWEGSLCLQEGAFLLILSTPSTTSYC